MTKKGKKRYVLVGTGARSFMFSESLLQTYKATAELAAICDLNPVRMAYNNAVFQKSFGIRPVRMYEAADFDKMIAREKAQVVIVATVDRTHHEYIIRALEAGCDVITEKPMTIDAVKCRAILDAVKRTGRKLTVTFNYRYSPSRSKVKELITQGVIGEVKSVNFEWLLDTRHGADYFRRWHRDKINSGGLMVHKATHHFDLLNWWLESSPRTVFGLGQLAFYGRANGESRGEAFPYTRSTGAESAKKDPFAIDLKKDERLAGLYLNAEKEDGYIRDQNVFGDGISIEDTMNLVIGYQSGAQVSYTLNAYSSCEGCRVSFNGTKGRIELDEREKSYIAAGKGHVADGVADSQSLMVFPHWEKPYPVEVKISAGGHGGGDLILLDQLFGKGVKRDPLGRAACHLDGARSVLTGLAANQSFATGQPVELDDILNLDRYVG